MKVEEATSTPTRHDILTTTYPLVIMLLFDNTLLP